MEYLWHVSTQITADNPHQQPQSEDIKFREAGKSKLIANTVLEFMRVHIKHDYIQNSNSNRI